MGSNGVVVPTETTEKRDPGEKDVVPQFTTQLVLDLTSTNWRGLDFGPKGTVIKFWVNFTDGEFFFLCHLRRVTSPCHPFSTP